MSMIIVIETPLYEFLAAVKIHVEDLVTPISKEIARK